MENWTSTNTTFHQFWDILSDVSDVPMHVLQ